MKLQFLVVCVAALLLSTPVPVAAQDEEGGGEPPAFRVTVELALIQAIVRDSRGEFVEGLTIEDFVLLEDGEPQPLVQFAEEPEAPVQVAFLLDVSGSMALQDRLVMARGAIRYFLDLLDERDEAALFVFAEGSVDVVTDFTTDRQKLSDGLLSRDGYGQTALIDAVARAPKLVPHRENRRGAIVLFSDGVDNISRLNIDQALELARRTDVPVYSIGLLEQHEAKRRAVGAKVLRSFSRETGGEAFFADDYYEVHRASRTVVNELKQAYVLGYYPSPGAGPHRVEIQARCRGCRVTARQGLYARPATDG